MGMLDSIRTAFGGLVPGASGPSAASFVDFRGLFEDYVLGLSPEDMFRTQPHLRTVVTFLARNIAQLGLHTFERVSDTDRRRDKDSAIAQALKSPNDYMTTYDLVYRLIADLALYDEALWVVEEDFNRPAGWRIQPMPPTWIKAYGGGSVFGYDWVDVQPPGTVKPLRITRDKFIYFHGWDPANLSKGTAPIAALRAVLQEQVHAVKYRDQIWRRAGRVGLTVTRPPQDKGSQWSAETKKKFKEMLDSKLAGADGADAGGSIILEDGMELKRLSFSAHEEEFVEGAKLALATVAQVYHVNPTMIGQLDNANFSNVREFRRMLYGETLGPLLAQIEDALNAFLVPRLEPDSDLYVEFNIQEKLQGSFEEQATVMQSATGRPWQTVNEARARFNMTEIEGGDDLSIPLNVVLGGGTQASVLDSAPPKGIEMLGELMSALSKSAGGTEALRRVLEAAKADPDPVLNGTLVVSSKSRAPGTYETNAARLLKSFYARQRKAVLSAMGAKAAEWWDEARWNKELGDDLFKLAVQTATKIGMDTATALGFESGDYDQDRTLKFLRAVSDSRAEKINATTYAALTDALDRQDEEDGPTPDSVFDEAEDVRSASGASALVTTFSAFATVEAATQLAGGKAMKTWRVTSGNPRSEHAAMDGESVPVDEPFSNGANWPGDPVLGADGVSNCQCAVDVEIP